MTFWFNYISCETGKRFVGKQNWLAAVLYILVFRSYQTSCVAFLHLLLTAFLG
jgi:hypothetical protein